MRRAMVTGLVLVAGAAVMGCDGSNGGGEPPPQVTADLTFTCSSPSDQPFTEDVSVAVLQQCNYWQSNAALHLTLIADVPPEEPNPSVVDILIAGLAGPGAYPTNDAGTTALRLGGPHYNASSSLVGFPGPGDCTLAVLDTNLHEVEIPESGVARGWISLDVRCPHLVTGGAELMQCAVTPSSFQLTVVGCEVAP